jgi:thiamine-phosphate pyrophosphorylase
LSGENDLDEGIEDDRLRLIIPLPKAYDPAPLTPLVDHQRIAALVLPPEDDATLAKSFGRQHGIAVFARDDVRAARGLDGLLLTRPAEVADARRALSGQQVIGVLCGVDRHEAMEAGEAGADWILFGRTDMEPSKAIEAAAWWSELFVLPCGVTGLIEPAHMEALAAAKIAFALPGPFCWQVPDPIGLLSDLDLAVQAAEHGTS